MITTAFFVVTIMVLSVAINTANPFWIVGGLVMAAGFGIGVSAYKEVWDDEEYR